MVQYSRGFDGCQAVSCDGCSGPGSDGRGANRSEKDCGAHALKVLRDRIAEERCVYILFPEGTRTRTGEPGRFKAGLGRLVAGTPVPVVPCRIEGSFRALPAGAWLPKPVRITIRVGPPLLFDGEPDDRAGWTRVAAEAEAAVAVLGTGIG